MTKLGFVWILIYRACGSGQCPGLSVYSCQLGSPGHPLLATLHWQHQAGDGSQLLPAESGKLVPQPNIAI